MQHRQSCWITYWTLDIGLIFPGRIYQTAQGNSQTGLFDRESLTNVYTSKFRLSEGTHRHTNTEKYIQMAGHLTYRCKNKQTSHPGEQVETHTHTHTFSFTRAMSSKTVSPVSLCVIYSSVDRSILVRKPAAAASTLHNQPNWEWF